ncbi:protein-glutamate methylesterase/protein-glutamine glutaminase [Thermosediminibacter litoriperuensis]|uniref:Protein-glutamate methylesterase/protein-glutamine glutaminase n=1 Tax=Thermosediminibacter litoriperuensis TaxID=291989 RepID=A0A5S5ARN4_9FIRM|nr:chemotaxis response regulator protein-glutamate methylesterase [Thermosediminibacter litoriperuensis]TYP53794.1 two-component system chemotaxis response regulator CheB [Thermosediminibacter litoriperuensis]
MIRVLVADDSALMRLMIKDLLEKDPEIKVVDTARNGREAVEKAEKLKPDVITMDVQMPEMDGISALKQINEKKLGKVLMLSSLTREGAEVTLKALEMGAFDFVAKPGGSISPDIKEFADKIIAKVKAGFKAGSIRERPVNPPVPSIHFTSEMKAVVIGISTGGPRNIMHVLPFLPPDINAAVFLVQHMPPAFTGPLARRLDERCSIKVVEAEDGMEVKPGTCYVGKGGYNLLLFGDRKNCRLVLTDTPKNRFMPSADVTMDSVFTVFRENTIGVIMTGMGDDGAGAMVRIKKAGGRTIAESRETAVIFGMPRAAIERGGAEFVLPSYEIPAKLTELAGVRMVNGKE